MMHRLVHRNYQSALIYSLQSSHIINSYPATRSLLYRSNSNQASHSTTTTHATSTPPSSSSSTPRLSGFSYKSNFMIPSIAWDMGNIEIRESSGGYGLFASRSLKRGEILWTERPVVCVKRVREVEEDEAEDDEEEVNQPDASAATPPSSLFCSHCHSPLLPPPIYLDTQSASSSVAPSSSSSSQLWSSLISQPSFLTEFGLSPHRTPLAAPTSCRTNSSSHPLHDSTIAPCDEQFCSAVCEEEAWSMRHQHEHMTTQEEIAGFTPENLRIMQDDPYARDLTPLLMRVIAEMRCTPSTQSPTPPHGFSIFDHLSLLSAPHSLNIFQPHLLQAYDEAFGPLMKMVLEAHPELDDANLTQHFDIFGNHLNATQQQRHQRVLHALLSGLATNSFHFVRTRNCLVLHDDSSDGHSKEKILTVSPLPSTPEDTIEYSMLFTTASFMNHSCSPGNNIAIDMSDEESDRKNLLVYSTLSSSWSTPKSPQQHLYPPVRFAALRDIKEGEELFWMYSHNPSELPKRYGFTCRCESCRKRMNA